MTEPYYTDGHRTIYHADTDQLLPLLLDHVDSMVTDPPYGINAQHRPRHADHGNIEVDWDDEVPYGTLGLLLDRPAIVFGHPSMIYESMATFAPPPHRVMIWSPSFTLALAAAGGIAYRYHVIYTWNLPKQQPAVWDVIKDPTEQGNWWGHPGTKPVNVMRRLCQMVPGTIIDPYLGSGTTLRAAKDLGRTAIGIERDEAYCEIAAERLAQESLYDEIAPPHGEQGALSW